MIQRIQSIYLLCAFACCMACLCLPVGHFAIGGDWGGTADMYNLWVRMPDGQHAWQPWALFVLLVLTATLVFVDIFLYKRRMWQMRLCTFCIALLAGWYVAYGAFAYLLSERWEAHFRIHWSASLPLIALILLCMAFRGIFKDEMLVKSLDRLR